LSGGIKAQRDLEFGDQVRRVLCDAMKNAPTKGPASAGLSDYEPGQSQALTL